jgi:hypothetical protein
MPQVLLLPLGPSLPWGALAAPVSLLGITHDGTTAYQELCWVKSHFLGSCYPPH